MNIHGKSLIKTAINSQLLNGINRPVTRNKMLNKCLSELWLLAAYETKEDNFSGLFFKIDNRCDNV